MVMPPTLTPPKAIEVLNDNPASTPSTIQKTARNANGPRFTAIGTPRMINAVSASPTVPAKSGV